MFGRREQFVFLGEFLPHVPENWQKRVETMLDELKTDGLKVRYLTDYIADAGIPDNLVDDLKKYLEEQGFVVRLNDQYYWHSDHFKEAFKRLKEHTGTQFEIGDAKKALNLSRKYMIPFLERLDALGLTKRVENKRIWQ